MVKIVLARHGETEENQERILQGQMENDLNQNGVEQSRKLAERLEDEEFDHIYTSSLPRCRQTAEIVAEKHGMEPKAVESLKEIDLGALQGKDFEEWHSRMKQMGEDFYHWSPEEGESMRELEDRILETIEEFSGEHLGGKILVVTHGGPISALVMGLFGTDRDKYLNIQLTNASISRLAYDQEAGWKLEKLNSTCHLGSNTLSA